jgi:hypothetical protein
MDNQLETSDNSILIIAVSGLLNQSRNRVALAVNPELTILYWNIGKKSMMKF